MESGEHADSVATPVAEMDASAEYEPEMEEHVGEKELSLV